MSDRHESATRRRCARGVAVAGALALLAAMTPALAGVAAAGAGTGRQGGAPTILLTNDDGYRAPQLQALDTALTAAGFQVTVVAPCHDRSGAGTGQHYRGTMQVHHPANDTWAVCGTPPDAVAFGLQRVFHDAPPDLVVSGINPGQNIGAIATHSGTTSAAVTAEQLGVPSIAVSTAFNMHSHPPTLGSVPDTAAFTVQLVRRLQQRSRAGRLLLAGVALNVNYPAVTQPRGLAITRQGRTAFIAPDFRPARKDDCADCYRVQPSPQDRPEPVRHADTTALAHGKISITPLDGDWTAASRSTARLRHLLHGLRPSRPPTGRYGTPQTLLRLPDKHRTAASRLVTNGGQGDLRYTRNDTDAAAVRHATRQPDGDTPVPVASRNEGT